MEVGVHLEEVLSLRLVDQFMIPFRCSRVDIIYMTLFVQDKLLMVLLRCFQAKVAILVIRVLLSRWWFRDLVMSVVT